MSLLMNETEIERLLSYKLDTAYGITIDKADDQLLYRTIAEIVNELLQGKSIKFGKAVRELKAKRVYYLCMEFLMGRSLKNNLFNLGLYGAVSSVLEKHKINPSRILESEPDAGIGNGGLGRLGACFLDAMATGGYPSMGYSICYEYGIFKQKIVDGWQNELPDNWLEGGDVWLNARPADEVEVRFGGKIEELWEGGFNNIKHVGYQSVKAVPYDMYVSGYQSEAVSTLRLFKSQNPDFNMQLFNSGDYLGAVEKSYLSEIISKVLYPNDSHRQGKELRLRQQYFLTAASVADIVKRHLADYGTIENFSDKTAIHINDTHPALAIAELMRIFIDECGFDWDKAWRITTETFAYTNHTVMSEALEVWDESLVSVQLPRIYSIIKEIDRRQRNTLTEQGVSLDAQSRMAVLDSGRVRMANLSVLASHTVNGVSKLHSQIIKDSVFHDFYRLMPDKFTNVTNGIAYRRWLQQSNPALYNLLCELAEGDVSKDATLFEKLPRFVDDSAVLEKIRSIKHQNKIRFAEYIQNKQGIVIDPDSIFDVQVKRLHEYKRQHLNALHILSLYQRIKSDPNYRPAPRTFLFGAKAAPGYFMAKQIIRLIYSISELVASDPAASELIKVVYLEDYNVTMSEILMPAAEVSEQISLAGTEASGTGNMKLMLGGAITLGTLDGANIEISEQVGRDNIVIFGMTAEEVSALRISGYRPHSYYDNDPEIKAAVDLIRNGICHNNFTDIADSLLTSDPYMVLADFRSYRDAHEKILSAYGNKEAFARSSFLNTARAGLFAADRAIGEYADRIWSIHRL